MSAMTERTTAQTDATDTYDASNEATTPCGGGGGGGGCGGGSEFTDLDDGENNMVEQFAPVVAKLAGQ